MSNQDHHYVPKFLIDRWAIGGQLTSFGWNQGAKRVLCRNPTVAGVCQITNLNALHGVPRASRFAVEKALGDVDARGATALAKILTGGIQRLSRKDREDWAKFLISLGTRAPETLDDLGSAAARRTLDMLAGTGPGPPAAQAVVDQMLLKNQPMLERNWPRVAALGILNDTRFFGALTNMHWWTRRFVNGDLLLGDRPLLSYPEHTRPNGIPLDNPKCLVALPIAPDVLFLATADLKTRATMRNMPRGKLLRLLNETTIHKADVHVYGRLPDQALRNFVEAQITPKAAQPVAGLPNPA